LVGFPTGIIGFASHLSLWWLNHGSGGGGDSERDAEAERERRRQRQRRRQRRRQRPGKSPQDRFFMVFKFY